MLRLVERLWELNSDQRLCQMLSNVAFITAGWRDEDLFHLEDDALEAALEATCEAHRV
jgi:hypothetical protein